MDSNYESQYSGEQVDSAVAYFLKHAQSEERDYEYTAIIFCAADSAPSLPFKNSDFPKNLPNFPFVGTDTNLWYKVPNSSNKHWYQCAIIINSKVNKVIAQGSVIDTRGETGVSSFADLEEVKDTYPSANQVWGWNGSNYTWLNTQSGDYLLREVFDKLFTAMTEDGSPLTQSQITAGATIYSIRANYNLYSVGSVSAYGIGSESGGGGGGQTYYAGKYITIDSNYINVDLDTLVPALDIPTISDWAKASTKPTYTTTEVTEGTNLYFTDERAQAALSEHTQNTTIHITSAERTKWNTLDDFFAKDDDLGNISLVNPLTVKESSYMSAYSLGMYADNLNFGLSGGSSSLGEIHFGLATLSHGDTNITTQLFSISQNTIEAGVNFIANRGLDAYNGAIFRGDSTFKLGSSKLAVENADGNSYLKIQNGSITTDAATYIKLRTSDSQNITMSEELTKVVGNVNFKDGEVSIGNIYLAYVEADNALKIYTYDADGNETTANLYATGGISAYGYGDESSPSGVSQFKDLYDVINADTDPAENLVWGIKEVNSGVPTYDWIQGGKTYTGDGSTIKVDGTTISVIGDYALKSWVTCNFAPAGNYLEPDDISDMLTKTEATVTYLTKVDAETTYQPVGDYALKSWVSSNFNKYVISKSDVESVLTGDITSHTHSQYLKSTEAESTYLNLSGGTMTGELILKKDQFEVSGKAGVDANNSDVVGVNALFMGASDGVTYNGIRFWGGTDENDNVLWDSLTSYGGVLYYKPEDSEGGSALSSAYKVLHSGNITGYSMTLWGHKVNIGGTYENALTIKNSTDSSKSVTLEVDENGYLKINGNVYATGGVSAYGILEEESPTGITHFAELYEVKNASTPSTGQLWGKTSGGYGWFDQSEGKTYSGSTTIDISSDNAISVNTDALGIPDAYTKTQSDAKYVTGLTTKDGRIVAVVNGGTGTEITVPYATESAYSYCTDDFVSAKTIALTGAVTGSAQGGNGTDWSIETTIANSAVTNDMLAGSIANDKLANSKMTLWGADVALGGTRNGDLSDVGNILFAEDDYAVIGDSDKGFNCCYGHFYSSPYNVDIDITPEDDSGALVIKAGSHNVGIATSEPQYDFDVNGVTYLRDKVGISGIPRSDTNLTIYGSTWTTSSLYVGVGKDNSNYGIHEELTDGALLLFRDTPYIDFHRGLLSDYNVRLINDEEHVLHLDGVTPALRIGDAYIHYDSTNNALYVDNGSGGIVNFYATGGVSAYGTSTLEGVTVSADSDSKLKVSFTYNGTTYTKYITFD